MIAAGLTICVRDSSRLAVRMVTADEAAPRARVRSGGKAPGPKLLRPVDPSSKRGLVLARLLDDPDAERAAEHFDMTRRAIFTTLTTLHREHAIGYAASGAITILLPKGVTPEGGLWL
jgi:hypothetical protein